MKKILTILAIISTSVCPPILAASSPIIGEGAIPLPSDTRLIVFPYDPNTSFTILSRPNSVTDIQLGPDEKITALAVGDQTLWTFKATPSGDHIFVRPLRSDIFTSGTLITTKRTYQFNFKSVSDRASWYQRVSWQYPDLTLMGDMGFSASGVIDAATTGSNRQFPPANSNGNLEFPDSSSSSMQRARGAASPENLNFNYKVIGKADFSPTQVFDDGKFTWIKIVGAQEWPAVFALNSAGETEIVNFVVKGNCIVVQRLAPGFLLVLGKEKVRIERTGV